MFLQLRRCELPKKGGNVYGRGWTAQRRQQMEAIILPDRLGCNVCGKLQLAGKVSEIWKNRLINAIAFRKVNPSKLDEEAWIKCINCTGKQNTEMKCFICDRTKGLDGFTKAQRRTPDEARCIECVAEHHEDLPDGKSKHDSDDETESVSNIHDDSTFGSDDESGGIGVGLSDYGDTGRSGQNELNEENLRNLDISSGAASSRMTQGSMSSERATDRGDRAPSVAERNLRKWNDFGRSQGEAAQSAVRYNAPDSDGVEHQRIDVDTSTIGSCSDDDSSSGNTVRNDTVEKRRAKKANQNFATNKEIGTKRRAFKPPPYQGRDIQTANSDSGSDPEYFI